MNGEEKKLIKIFDKGRIIYPSTYASFVVHEFFLPFGTRGRVFSVLRGACDVLVRISGEPTGGWRKTFEYCKDATLVSSLCAIIIIMNAIRGR